MLKDEIRSLIEKRCQQDKGLKKILQDRGVENYLDLVADEDSATAEEEVMEFMQQVNHPALELEPIWLTAP